MRKYEKQLFAETKENAVSTQELSPTAFDSQEYCDFSDKAVKAMAGKDMLLAIWNAAGTSILAIAGQKTLKINRSADTIEVTTKDSGDGWKSYIPGLKEWSIDLDGIYIKDDESQTELSKAFNDGEPVCIKVYDQKAKKGMFGGLAVITDYPLEASHDDAVTYTMTFTGMGKLVDLSINKPSTDTLPA